MSQERETRVGHFRRRLGLDTSDGALRAKLQGYKQAQLFRREEDSRKEEA